MMGTAVSIDLPGSVRESDMPEPSPDWLVIAATPAYYRRGAGTPASDPYEDGLAGSLSATEDGGRQDALSP